MYSLEVCLESLQGEQLATDTLGECAHCLVLNIPVGIIIMIEVFSTEIQVIIRLLM